MTRARQIIDEAAKRASGRRAPLAQARHLAAAMLAVAAMALAGLAGPLAAQDTVESFDPDEAYSAPSEDAPAGPASGAIDGDLDPAQPQSRPDPRPQPAPRGPAEVETSRAPGFDEEFSGYAEGTDQSVPAEDLPAWSREEAPEVADAAPGATPEAAAESATYGEDDLIGAAERVFGKGAEGLAGLIEDLLRKQGEPNGYIVGREAGGAFIVGARYGSGTLHHKVEGTRKVYWTGPSIGFDAGANAGNTFVLVYNLYDTEDLFKRFPAGEGQAYFVGGLTASYLRKGDIVLIPIRVGAGLRLGVNAGYMKFSKKQRWLPF
ncbi:DUF1134 domain-containing protein [Erythrobacter sp. HL-111]|uniref:DUF1134 domain-containing protein n=1 Tax=Erythrobacter sp. HL-111 TaxID=1798193 RepID=UPI0006D9AEE2|nr:DUF1134 domain-containing protein [Erythrobacter sp. HL-111]KPP92932.1 MAG: hypothetical protein HLUCCO15_07230 [Erythrobacteraceae bacterium HL-111]SDT02391.1 hypothetical protein SAMN04515621_2740 [Erythrobacter sp. HL-111]